MTEVWRDIPGYEGRYQASDLGRVRGLRGVLKPFPHRDGYLQVKLCLDGDERTFFVHRIVGFLFVNNPQQLPEIDHLDEDKTHNSAENLEWVTRQENMRRAFASGKAPTCDNTGELNGMAIVNEATVLAIRAEVARGALHRVVADNYGISRRAVGRIADGSRWGHVK